MANHRQLGYLDAYQGTSLDKEAGDVWNNIWNTIASPLRDDDPIKSLKPEPYEQHLNLLNPTTARLVSTFKPEYKFLRNTPAADPEDPSMKWYNGQAAYGTTMGLERGHSKGGPAIPVKYVPKWAQRLAGYDLEKMNLAGGVIPLTQSRATYEIKKRIVDAYDKGDLKPLEDAWTKLPESRPIIDKMFNEKINPTAQKVKGALPWVTGAAAIATPLLLLMNQRKAEQNPQQPQQPQPGAQQQAFRVDGPQQAGMQQLSPQQQDFFNNLDKLRQQQQVFRLDVPQKPSVPIPQNRAR